MLKSILLGAVVFLGPLSSAYCENIQEAQAARVECPSGGISEAIKIAVDRFSAHIERMRGTGAADSAVEFLSYIDNYEVRALLKDGVYEIKIYPLVSPLGFIKGAGAVYIISRCSLEIVEIRGQA